MGENNPIIGDKDYILLKDFKVETEVDEEKGFVLCFWVFIFGSNAFPATILKQVYAEANSSSPLLVLNEKTLMLLPLTCLHNEAPGLRNTDLTLMLIFSNVASILLLYPASISFLLHRDFELLWKIAGCQDYMAQENFEKMWCWLYPVAFTLSSDRIKAMWNSTSPKWIEGFITKEEAELSLQGPRGLQEPGTFILRFPTSRSWPHPDAGSLVVTYVGSDYALHNRLLSLDNLYSSEVWEMNVKVKPLQDMLLEEPELSRLGRMMRRH